MSGNELLALQATNSSAYKWNETPSFKVSIKTLCDVQSASGSAGSDFGSHWKTEENMLWVLMQMLFVLSNFRNALMDKIMAYLVSVTDQDIGKSLNSKFYLYCAKRFVGQFWSLWYPSIIVLAVEPILWFWSDSQKRSSSSTSSCFPTGICIYKSFFPVMWYTTSFPLQTELIFHTHPRFVILVWAGDDNSRS